MLYGFGFLWALQQDSFEERLFTWGWSMKLLGLIGAWVLFTKLHREHRAKKAKQERRPILRAERREAMSDLESLRDRCIEVCTQGDVQLVE